MKKLLLILIVVQASFVTIISCKKDPGKGGSSSLTGRVLVRDYNSTYTVLQEEYYGQAEDVYIIYGDDKFASDRTRTNYDGTYEFPYLQKGTYHVYAYSDDSTLQSNAKIPVIRDVAIGKNGQEVEVPLIKIVK